MHIQFMQQALALAEQARFHTPPNPWVGCLIVKNGQIVGHGVTQPPGQAHAEIEALKQAQEQAQGATVYVTLEPCAHTGRTPPCVDALIRAQVREVYVGIQDPDARVSGKGMALLQEAGIQVFHGLCAQDIQNSLRAYVYQRQTGLPYTILKAAISLDGRIAAEDQTSQWITCPEARQDVHHQRACSQAIVIGSGTALKDLPNLTARHSTFIPRQPPLRVLLDTTGRVPAQGPLFDTQIAPTLVFTSTQTPSSRRQEWEATGAEVTTVPYTPHGLDLSTIWHVLGQRHILQVLVEGGAQLQTALLETSLVNRLCLYVGPLLLGSSGYPLYHKHISTLQNAQHLYLEDMQQFGHTVRLNYALSKKI